MIGCLWTRVCKQPIIALNFLKFYNLDVRSSNNEARTKEYHLEFTGPVSSVVEAKSCAFIEPSLATLGTLNNIYFKSRKIIVNLPPYLGGCFLK